MDQKSAVPEIGPHRPLLEPLSLPNCLEDLLVVPENFTAPHTSFLVDSTPSSSVDFGPVVYPIDPDWTEDFRLCHIFQISGVLECFEFVKRTCE